MYLKRFRLRSFSSFADTGDVELSPKMNVVLGPNNSGKSALLKAIAGAAGENPHKSKAAYRVGDLSEQRIELDFVTSTDELRSKIAISGIPVRTSIQEGPDPKPLLDRIEGSEQLDLRALHTSSGFTQREPLFGKVSGRAHQYSVFYRQGKLIVERLGNGVAETVLEPYFAEGSESLFYFPAERQNYGKVVFGRYPSLLGIGSNLAGFLAYIQGNSVALFEELIAQLRRVIPSVRSVSIDMTGDGFSILVWSTDDLTKRELAFPLSECGTGVGQILAILSVAVTRQNNIIIVDEINSHLHPLAAKEMLNILATEYPTNQYVISSHSSEVISHSSVQSLIQVERQGDLSSIKAISPQDLPRLRTGLRELGVSMTDVLGADKIIWVEGPTEEIVFPLLTQRFIKDDVELRYAAINGPSDITESARNKAVMRRFEHISKVVAPLGVEQRFLLDRESLSDSSVDKLAQSSDGRMHFLSRRCIECYALFPAYIADVLNAERSEEQPVTFEQVAGKMRELATSGSLSGAEHFSGELTDVDWLRRVDAAKLLTLVWNGLSDGHAEFVKTRHVPQIFERMDEAELAPLIAELRAERDSF